MDEEVKDLDKKIKKLKKKISRAKKVSVVISIVGAVITTVFAVTNILLPAVISFVITIFSTFIVDLVKRIFMIMLWRSNKHRNELIIGENESEGM